MSKQKRKPIVPERRFPEFRDAAEWAVQDLGELISTITPPKKLLTSDYLATGQYPVVDQSQNYISGWTNDEDAIIDDNLPLIVFGDHTCILKLIDQPFAQGADGIKIFKPNDSVQARFLYQSLQFKPLVMEQYKRHFSIFKERKVAFPDQKTSEQQKIADCLSSIDELIVAETQKFNALKTHKKGLMQQLFPAKDETVPKLRFSQFRDTKEWEPTTVGQIADFKSGGTPSKGNPAFWNGTIPWASAKDMKQLFLNDTEDHITTAAVDAGAKPAPAGTVLMLTRGMTLLKDVPICILSRPMSYNQDVKALQPKRGFDGRFLAYLLLGCKHRLLNLVDIAGHGTGRLDTDKLKALDVMLPQPAEQHRIADCLSSLEVLLCVQSQKINVLKAHKKGLMQQLFPAMNEVGA